MMWLINVCWANREEALFEKFKVAAESYSTLSTITGVETKLRCSGHCVVNVECTGFRFNEFNGECRMIGCMNPVYDLTGDNGEEVYFQRPTALLARDKPATMSSISKPISSADKANDGIYRVPSDNEDLSLAHTDGFEDNPWWRVDLEKVHCVRAVRILNRGDAAYAGIYERSKNVYVNVANAISDLFNNDAGSQALCGYVDGVINRYYTLITCGNPIRGRLVQVLMKAYTLLNVHEIEVHGI